MSIIDWLLLYFFTAGWLVVALIILGFLALRRWAHRIACNDIDDRVNRGRERTRHSSIERHA